MKTDKEYSDTIKREVEVDVDALLAAINEISESEVRRTDDNSDRVIVNGRIITPTVNWPRPSSLISMTLACLKRIVRTKKSRSWGWPGSNLLMQEALRYTKSDVVETLSSTILPDKHIFSWRILYF